MKIRLARDIDLAEIARLRRHTIRNVNAKDYPDDVIHNWSASVGAQELRKSADAHKRWVALEEKKIIGFCEHDFKEISRIYVHKDHLREGVGSRLLEVAEDSLIQQGLKEITLKSTVTAKDFYERNGYQVIEKSIYNEKNKNVPVFRMAKKFR